MPGVPPNQIEALIQRLLSAPDQEVGQVAAEIQQQLHAKLAPGLLRHFERKAPQHADDLAQQTWILFWESLKTRRYDPARARPSTFLYALAHIILLRSGRKAARGAMTEIEELAAWTRDKDPLEAIELAAEIELVRGALAGGASELSEADRAALRAVSLGRTDRELARDLGISPSTAHERKKTALERLRRYLGAAGFGGDSGRAPGTGEAKKR